MGLLAVFSSSAAWAAPDISYQSLSGPASTLAGQAATFSYRVRNVGTADATDVTIVLRASTDDDYDILGTPDPEICAIDLGTLAPGATVQQSTTCTWPAGVTGSLYVVSRVLFDQVLQDPTPLDGERFYGPVQVVDGGGGGQPDLVADQLGVPASGAAGAAFAVSFRARNTGTATAGASTGQVRLSADTTWDAGDVLLCSVAVPSLNAGQSSVLNPTGCAVPGGAAPGSAYLLARVDTGSVVAESNEANNTTSAAFTVSAPPVVERPNLVVRAAGPLADAAPGDALVVGYVVENAGDAASIASVAGAWLSADTSPDASDELLCTEVVPALAAGASATRSLSGCTLPPGTAEGAWQVIVGVDVDRDVDESDESDNARAVSLTVRQDAVADTAGDPDPPDTGGGVPDVPGDSDDGAPADGDGPKDDFPSFGQVGCTCATGGVAGAGPAALLALLLVRRRRSGEAGADRRSPRSRPPVRAC